MCSPVKSRRGLSSYGGSASYSPHRHKFNKKSYISEEENEDSDNQTYKWTKKGLPTSHTPCRRSCSTIHHPVFHVGRHGQGTTKPAKLKRERPKSVDKVKDIAKREDQQLDWSKTELNNTLLKVNNIVQTKIETLITKQEGDKTGIESNFSYLEGMQTDKQRSSFGKTSTSDFDEGLNYNFKN